MDHFSLFDDHSFLFTDPNFQEAANNGVNTTTLMASHFENDLAIFSPSTYSNVDKVCSFSHDILKINDIPCTSLSQNVVDVKTEAFYHASGLSPPQTVKQAKPLSLQTAAYLQSSNHGESQYSGVPLLHHNNNNIAMMSNEDIDDFLISPNSKASSGGDNRKVKETSTTYEPPVPSTSDCKPQQNTAKKSCPEYPNKNALTARANRLKNKMFVEELKNSIVFLREENRDLTQRLKSVTAENEKKDSMIEYLRNVLLDENKIFKFLKEVTFLTSVGFPTEGRSVRTSVPPDKMETQEEGGESTSWCTTTKISKSETPVVASSSFSCTTPFFSASSIQVPENITVDHDPSLDDDDNQFLRKDPPIIPCCSSSDNDNNIGDDIVKQQIESKYLGKDIFGKVKKKSDHQRCFSSWGSKGKGKKNLIKNKMDKNC